jgi:hypothetical protein
MSNSPQELKRWGPFGRLVTWWRGKSKEQRRRSRAPRKLKANREDFVKYALENAAAIEAKGDPEEMHRITYKLLRLDLYERAWELRTRAAELDQPSPIPEWDGGDLAGRTVLVRAYTPRDRIGEELRLARFIAPVSRQARRCIVLGDRRLVPLLQRSFAGVEVRPRGIDEAAAFAEADIGAYYETIALRCVKTAEDMKRAFVPLRADPTRVASVRQRYNAESRGPLLGISWGSSNPDKLLPDLKSWAPLLGWKSATFVSLQYGDIKNDLEALRELTGGRVIHDTEINQLIDLDGFAAQIAALDGVISISNTTIDMAGMLAVPTVHIRDDNLSSAIWPRSGPSPWYPDMIFLYRERRPWSELFAEARTRLEQVISTGR